MSHTPVKRGLNELAKSINQRQPEQSAQADMGWNFLLSSNILYVKGWFYLMIQSDVRQNGFYGSIINEKYWLTHY